MGSMDRRMLLSLEGSAPTIRSRLSLAVSLRFPLIWIRNTIPAFSRSYEPIPVNMFRTQHHIFSFSANTIQSAWRFGSIVLYTLHTTNTLHEKRTLAIWGGFEGFFVLLGIGSKEALYMSCVEPT